MKINKNNFVLILFCIYSFLTPLGMMVKFGNEEGSLGITTYILLFIILISFNSVITSVFKSKLLISIFLLIMWLIFASIFSYDIILSLFSGLTLLLYLAAASISKEILYSNNRIFIVFLFFCIGGLISSTATIIDFFGIVKIPGINENSVGTSTELGNILQASGPFARRSAMAVYYTMIITIGFLYAIFINNKSKFYRLLFFISALNCLVALLLTHNRSGVVSAFLIVFSLIFILEKKFINKLKLVLYILLVIILFVFFIINFIPDVWNAYQALFRIGNVVSANNSLEESDTLRIELFQHSLQNLTQNPFGNGYGLISKMNNFEDGLIDPHNIITQIIWGAGLFGFIWVIYFGYNFIKFSINIFKFHNKLPIDKTIFVLLGALISFFVVGMMHTIISTGMMWIFFGCYLHLGNKIKN
jgi:hypothetical protein